MDRPVCALMFRTVALVVALVLVALIGPGQIEVASAGSGSSSTMSERCVSGAGKTIGTIVIGTALFLIGDCALAGCSMTASTLIAAGAASIGIGAAVAAIVLKAGVAAAAFGCADAVTGK